MFWLYTGVLLFSAAKQQLLASTSAESCAQRQQDHTEANTCSSSSTLTKNPDPSMSGKNERTFLAVKPDGVQRGLVGEVLKRFEQRGYKIVGLKMIHADEKLLQAHYAEHVGKPFFKSLVSFMSSGPVVAFVVEGLNAVKAARKMLGATKPQDSEPGTLRGDFSIDMGRNLIHGSDSLESAAREISLWFREEELVKFDKTISPWIYE